MPAVTESSSPNGLPIATHPAPTSTVGRVAERQRGERPRATSTLRTAMSLYGSLPTIFALTACRSGSWTVIDARSVDDVVVRDDVPRLVEHEAGALALCLLLAAELTEAVAPGGHPATVISTTPAATSL